MLTDYFPILVFLGVGIGMGAVLLAVGAILGPRNPSDEKNSAYECGFEAFEDSRMKFDVRFYLIAILFIIFDLEIAFMFPWAVVLDSVGMTGLVAMGIFLLILVIGFVYEWKKGALEWELARCCITRMCSGKWMTSSDQTAITHCLKRVS